MEQHLQPLMSPAPATALLFVRHSSLSFELWGHAATFQILRFYILQYYKCRYWIQKDSLQFSQQHILSETALGFRDFFCHQNNFVLIRSLNFDNKYEEK